MARGSAEGPPKKRGRKAPARRRTLEAISSKKAAETVANSAAKRVRGGPSARAGPAKITKRPSTLATELREAQARQAASSEILRIISQSPGNVQPMFDAIVLAAVRLLGDTVHFLLRDGSTWAPVAVAGPKGLVKALPKAPLPVDPDANFASRVILSRKNLHLPDWSKLDLPPFERRMQEVRGTNSSLLLPLLRGKECIGVLAIGSKHANHFGKGDIALAESFRDQAVIAIENARLFNETQEALERQTATAGILKVIASSPSNVQPVFDAIAESAKRLLGSHTAVVTRVNDDMVQFAAGTAAIEAATHAAQGLLPYPLSSDRIHARVARTGQLAVNIDAANSDLPENIKEFARTIGWRSMLVVPMLRNGIAIGTIGITRREAGSFDDKTVELLKTFADQAVIAIENSRLFNETSEALERQTATAEILKVIASSPDDVQPVFDAIAARANKLLGGHGATVLRIVGDVMELAAYTSVNEQSDAVLTGAFPIPIPGNPSFEAVRRGEVSEISDTEADIHAHLPIRDIGRARGFRSRLLVPLKTDSGVIGAISVTRVEPGTFVEHHVQLLQTFADQAVIAIQNVRLFKETQEALAQQTATADVLRVIGSSVADTAPVFEKILDSCESLFATEQLGIFLVQPDGQVNVVAWRGAAFEAVAHTLPRPLEQSATGVVIRNRGVLHFPSFATAKDMPRTVRDLRDQIGDASMAWAPMLAEGQGVGSIGVLRQPPNPFSDKELALLKTFADQAVIAIQNTRLFNETKEALERQTATADILKVIASSPDDVQPVFEAIAERSNRIVDGRSTAVYSLAEGILHLMAFTSTSPEADAKLRALFPRALSQMRWGEAVARGELFAVDDVQDPSVPQDARELALLRGYRSVLFVPLLSEGSVIGAISVTRAAPGSFANHHVELLKTFADQAVIAISNVELFNKVQERTRELSQSLDDLRAAQDRLVQTEKLASLGQLTAGIAHEIKNPLNFVNNFSALSAELTDELNEVLKADELTDQMRDEVGELTKLLKANLEKVVQHGRRADSIVKNMLLHSREGAGEQRSADVNALVEESLNLAYHGARAERPGFNITLRRDFDASAGAAELFPQEITRALLNLISNGFYAATRRNGEPGFEPTLLAATKNLGSSVEIRIRDNGSGIPPEVKDKMFNPFFTTKPAGEGTGLGLSMTHDIVVKQHGGKIDVATSPGEFTEFTIVLPRAGSPQPRKA